MPFEQSCSIEYGLEHASPMYEHQLMSRPCSQNSRMSVELVPNNFNPSPAYRVQHSHMSMSQPKQNCLDTYNGNSLSNNIGGSVGSHSRAPSSSSPEDFTDIFSPLKYVQRPVAFRRITEKNSIWHFLFNLSKLRFEPEPLMNRWKIEPSCLVAWALGAYFCWTVLCLISLPIITLLQLSG